MQLFITKLPIRETLTKENFVKLLLEWNSSSFYEANIISEKEWNGSYDCRFGGDDLWMEISDYPEGGIIAARYEKKARNGVLWDTDFVVNYNEMKISVVVSRVFTPDAVNARWHLALPSFISLLIKHGHLQPDASLSVGETPIHITMDNAGLLTDAVCGIAEYDLPVVYISKNDSGRNPVDAEKMAFSLKGAAHVMVEEKAEMNAYLDSVCGGKNVCGGKLGIYFAGKSYSFSGDPASDPDTYDNDLANKVQSRVFNICNNRYVDPMYTWDGVNSEKLITRLGRLDQMLKDQASAKTDADDMLALYEEENSDLTRNIADLKDRYNALYYENMWLREQLNAQNGKPLLSYGPEKDYFEGEVKALILSCLKAQVNSTQPRSRRRDVLEAVIEANDDGTDVLKKKTEEVKKILKGGRSLSPGDKRSLERLGFQISEEGSHIKLKYYGNDRYLITLSKTSSDVRAALNGASEIENTVF